MDRRTEREEFTNSFHLGGENFSSFRVANCNLSLVDGEDEP